MTESSGPESAPQQPDFFALDTDDSAPAAAPDLGAVEPSPTVLPAPQLPSLGVVDDRRLAQASYGQTESSSPPVRPQPGSAPPVGSSPQSDSGAPNYAQPMSSAPQPMVSPQQPQPGNPYFPEPDYAQSPYHPDPGHATSQWEQPIYQTYPPQPGAPMPVPVQRPYSPPPSGGDSDSMAAAAHWSPLLANLAGLGWLAPLLIMLTHGTRDARVRQQAAESLNFEITFLIVMVVTTILTIVTAGLAGLLFPLIGVAYPVLRIVAAVAVNQGREYRYPINLRLVK